MAKYNEVGKDKSDLIFPKDTRILVVDDSEINLYIVKGVISSFYDIECDIVLSGQSALAAVAKEKYDLIFMDYMMPEMDGIKTMNKIRAMGKSYAKIPVIALSADNSDMFREMLLGAGMNGFITKPIIVEEVGAVLQKWLPWQKKNLSAPENQVGGHYSQIPETIKRIGELDIRAGLSCVAFNEEAYINTLKILHDKIPDNIEAGEKYLSENKTAPFTILIHGMKGSLAAVGAHGLAETAQKLENASKAYDIDFCKKEYPDFAKKVLGFEEKLIAVFSANNGDEEKTAGTHEALKENLKALAEAVGDYDCELMNSIIERLDKYEFEPDIKNKIDLIKDYVQGFNYDKITETINELLF